MDMSLYIGFLGLSKVKCEVFFICSCIFLRNLNSVIFASVIN